MSLVQVHMLVSCNM